MQWSSQRVVVTGGSGFLGSYVVDALEQRGCTQITVPRSRDCDLRNPQNLERLFTQARPSLVIHLAAVVGGIGANQKHPGSFFYDNAIMGIQLLEFCKRFGVSKTVIAGTICAYPKFTPIPFREEELWSGYPEETNAPYGLAKKMLLVQAQAYREEFGTNAIYLLPVNLYGPRDNFDLETSHVIPALIRKCIEAKETGAKEIVLWGDGSPTREFLFARDAAEGILLGAEKYDGPEPVNLGSGQEISIQHLAELICQEIGFDGAIRWDASRPNGQPRRCLDTSRAKKYFGFTANTPFAEGLRETIEWYESARRLQAVAG